MCSLDKMQKVIDYIEDNLKGEIKPEAFTRAFQSLHGVTPSALRHNDVKIKAYTKLSFQIILRGDVSIEYRIEKKEI